MPEYVEIRRESDLINEHKKQTFKFAVSYRNRSVPIEIPYEEFRLEAASRGKELRVTFFDTKSHKRKSYVFGMGMSGKFISQPYEHEAPKNTRLAIIGVGGNSKTLYLTDRRNFCFWKEGSWNPKRGVDPLKDSKKWWDNLVSNLNLRIFNKPIYEVLMDQKYCNGIGNYLRAEILGRIDINPFQPARSYIMQAGRQLFDVTQDILASTYKYKVVQADKYNGTEPWLKYYKTGSYIDDKGGRRFWFDSKWDPNVKEMLKNQENVAKSK